MTRFALEVDKISREITRTSADGLKTTTTRYLDGNGTIDSKSNDETELLADGRRLRTMTRMTGQDAVVSKSIVETSADGLAVTSYAFADGNATVEAKSINRTEVLADGRTRRTTETFSGTGVLTRTGDILSTGGGERTSRTVSISSANGLQSEMHADANGDGTYESIMVTVRAYQPDGRMVETGYTYHGGTRTDDGYVRDGTISASTHTTSSADRLTTTTERFVGSLDRTNAKPTAVETATYASDGNRIVSLDSYSPDGATLIGRTRTTTSPDGLTVVREVDSTLRAGEGFKSDFTETSVTTLAPDGSTTKSTIITHENGDRRSHQITTTSADGLRVETRSDNTGSGVYDTHALNVTTRLQPGNITSTEQDYLGGFKREAWTNSTDGTLKSHAVTYTTANGLTEVINTDSRGLGWFDTKAERVQLSNGSTQLTVTQFQGLDGGVKRVDRTTTTADGLTTTTSSDTDGVNGFDHIRRDQTTLNADGSQTRTVRDQVGFGTAIHLKSAARTEASADGLTVETFSDADGDGDIDLTRREVTEFAVSGERITTAETRSGTTLIGRSVQTTEANGFGARVDVDSDGLNGFDRSTDTMTSLGQDGSQTTTTRHYTFIAGTRTQWKSEIVTVSADGLAKTTTVRVEDEPAVAGLAARKQGFVSAKFETKAATSGETVVTTVEEALTGVVRETKRVTTSADGLTMKTELAGSDGRFLPVELSVSAPQLDGTQIKTVTTYGADGHERDRSITTVSPDGLKTTGQLDIDANGIIDQTRIDTVVIKSDGGRSETLEATGTLNARSRTDLSSNGLVKVVIKNIVANGVALEQTVRTEISQSDGSETVTSSDVHGKSVVTKSADGLRERMEYYTGNTLSSSVSSIKTLRADGSTHVRVESHAIPQPNTAAETTRTVKLSDGTFAGVSGVIAGLVSGATVQSIFGLTTATPVTVPTSTELSISGWVETTTSANGLEITTRNASGTKHDVSVLDASGKRTQTIEYSVTRNGYTYVTEKYVEATSANGLEQTKDWYKGGSRSKEPTLDQTQNTIKVLNADGSTTETVESKGNVVRRGPEFINEVKPTGPLQVITTSTYVPAGEYSDPYYQTYQYDADAEGRPIFKDENGVAHLTRYIDNSGTVEANGVFSIGSLRFADGNSWYGVNNGTYDPTLPLNTVGKVKYPDSITEKPTDVAAWERFTRTVTTTSADGLTSRIEWNPLDGKDYAYGTTRSQVVHRTEGMTGSGSSVVSTFDNRSEELTSTAAWLAKGQATGGTAPPVIGSQGLHDLTEVDISVDRRTTIVRPDTNGDGRPDQIDETVTNIDGSITQTVREYDATGSQTSKAAITTSADGLTKTTVWEYVVEKTADKDATYPASIVSNVIRTIERRSRVDAVVRYADGAVERTITDFEGDGTTVREKQVTTTSADGLNQTMVRTKSEVLDEIKHIVQYTRYTETMTRNIDGSSVTVAKQEETKGDLLNPVALAAPGVALFNRPQDVKSVLTTRVSTNGLVSTTTGYTRPEDPDTKAIEKDVYLAVATTKIDGSRVTNAISKEYTEPTPVPQPPFREVTSWTGGGEWEPAIPYTYMADATGRQVYADDYGDYTYSPGEPGLSWTTVTDPVSGLLFRSISTPLLEKLPEKADDKTNYRRATYQSADGEITVTETDPQNKGIVSSRVLVERRADGGVLTTSTVLNKETGRVQSQTANLVSAYGKETTIEEYINGSTNTITDEEVGRYFGWSLSALATDGGGKQSILEQLARQAATTVASTVLKAFAGNFLRLLAPLGPNGLAGDAFTQGIWDATKNVDNIGADIASGLAALPFAFVGSLVSGQIIKALGLGNSFGDRLLGTLITSPVNYLFGKLGDFVLGSFATGDAIGSLAKFFNPETFVSGFLTSLPGTIAGFLGSYLASKVVAPEGMAGALGHSLGSAVGGYIGSVLGPSIVNGLGLVAGSLGAAFVALAAITVFVFIFAVIGTLLGNLFSKPKYGIATATLATGETEFEVSAWGNKGSLVDAVKQRAQSAVQIIEQYVAMTGGYIVGDTPDISFTFSIHKKNGSVSTNDQHGLGFAGTTDGKVWISYAVISSLRQLHIEGGNKWMTAALKETRATNIDQLNVELEKWNAFGEAHNFLARLLQIAGSTIADGRSIETLLRAHIALFAKTNPNYGVDEAVLTVLRELNFGGGNIYVERALLLARTGARATLLALAQDVDVALAYAHYVDNKTAIDRILSEERNSDLALRWQATLQYAHQIGIDGQTVNVTASRTVSESFSTINVGTGVTATVTGSLDEIFAGAWSTVVSTGKRNMLRAVGEGVTGTISDSRVVVAENASLTLSGDRDIIVLKSKARLAASGLNLVIDVQGVNALASVGHALIAFEANTSGTVIGADNEIEGGIGSNFGVIGLDNKIRLYKDANLTLGEDGVYSIALSTAGSTSTAPASTKTSTARATSATVTSDGNDITLRSNATLRVVPGASILPDTDQSRVTVTGVGNTAYVSNSEIALLQTAELHLIGANSKISLADNTRLVANGGGMVVAVSGRNVQLGVSSGVVRLANGASVTIGGVDNDISAVGNSTITAFDAAADISNRVTLSGASNVVALSDASFSLTSGSSGQIRGTRNSITGGSHLIYSVAGSALNAILGKYVALTLRGDNDNIVLGDQSDLDIGGVGNTAELNYGHIDIADAANLTLVGLHNEILLGSGVSLDVVDATHARLGGRPILGGATDVDATLHAEGQGNRASINFGTIDVQAGAGIELAGTNNAVTAAARSMVASTGANLIVDVTGKDALVSATAAHVTIATGASAIVTGRNNQIIERGNSDVTVVGTGANINVAGTGNRTVADDAHVAIAASGGLALQGDANTISTGADAVLAVTGNASTIMAGDHSRVTLTGRQTSVSIAAGEVALAVLSSATVAGDDNLVTLAGGNVVTIAGTGTDLRVAGSGNVADVSWAAIAVAEGATLSLIGHQDTISLASRTVLTADGTGLVIDVSGVAATAFASNARVSIGAGASALVSGSDNAITVSTDGRVVVNGVGAIVDLAGRDTTATVTGGAVRVGTGASGVVHGDGNALAMVGGGMLVAHGDYATLDIKGVANEAYVATSDVTVADQAGVTLIGASNRVIAGRDATVGIIGNNATIAAGNGSDISITGMNATASVNSGDVTIGRGSSADVTGAGNFVHIKADATAVVHGGGVHVTADAGAAALIDGRNAGIMATGADLDFSNGASGTLTGDANTVIASANVALDVTGNANTIVAGANAFIGLSGTGTSVSLSAGGTVTLTDGTTATISGGDATLTGGAATQIVAIGDGYTITAGVGSDVTVLGTNATVNLTDAKLTLSAGADVTLAGDDNRVTGANGATLRITGDNTIVTGSNMTIIIGAGLSVTVIGANDLLLVGDGSAIVIDGVDALVRGHDAIVGLTDGSSASFEGGGYAITAGEGASVEISNSAGDAATVGMSGGKLTLATDGAAVLTGSDNAVRLVNQAALDVHGDRSRILAQGVGAMVSLDGDANALVMNDGTLSLAIDSSANVAGNRNTITARSGDTLIVGGVDNTIAASGQGLRIGATDATIVLAHGTEALIGGARDTILAAGAADLTVLGANHDITDSGTGSSVSLAGTGDTLTINQGTVSLENGTTATIFGSGNTITTATNIHVAPDGSQLDITGNDGLYAAGDGVTAFVSGDQNFVAMGDRAAVGISGDANFVSAGTGSTGVITGDTNTLAVGADSLIDVKAGSGNTVIAGDRAEIRLAGDANTAIATVDAEVALVGTGGVAITGDRAKITATGSDGFILTGNDATLAVGGTNNDVLVGKRATIDLTGIGADIDADIDASIDVAGSGHVIRTTSSDISFSADASARIEGGGNTIDLDARDALVATGAGNTIRVHGAANIASVDLAAITLDNAAGLDVTGSTNTLTAGNATTIGIDGTANTVSAGTATVLDLSGSGNTATVGSGSTIDLAGTGQSLSTSGSAIDLAAGASATITGTSNTIDEAAGVDATIVGAGNTVAIHGSSGTTRVSAGTVTADTGVSTTILGGANSISGGAGASLTVTGNANTIGGNDIDLLLSGTGLTVTASNSDVIFERNALATVTGSSDRLTLRGNDTIAVTGSGATVTAQGTGNTLAVSGAIINVADNGELDVQGGHNTVAAGLNTDVAVAGSGNTVTSGAGSTIEIGGSATANVSGGTVRLAAGATATVIGNNDRLYETGNNALTASGSGHLLDVTGTGNAATIAGAGVTVHNGAAVALTGGNDTITAGTQSTVSVLGDTTTISAGAGSALSLTGQNQTITAGQSTVALGAGTSAVVHGDQAAVSAASSVTLTTTGSGETLAIQGTGVIANVAGAIISVVNGGTGTIIGNANMIGAGNGVRLSVTGDGTGLTAGSNADLDLAGINITATASGAAIDLAQGTTIALTGSGNAIDADGGNVISTSGSGNALIAHGTGSIADLTSSNVTVDSGATFTLRGVGNTLGVANGGAAVLDIGGSGNTATTGSASAVTVRGTNTSINTSSSQIAVASNAGATVTGSANQITGGTTSTISAVGTNNTVTAGAGSAASISGSAIVTLSSGVVNLAAASAATVYASGTTVTAGQAAQATINGSNDTLLGSGATFTVTGSGHGGTLTNSTVNLTSGTSIALNGSADTVNLVGGSTATLTGASHTANVSGIGNGVTISSGDVFVSQGADPWIIGTDNDIIVAPQASADIYGNNNRTTAGNGSDLSLEGTGQAINASGSTIALGAGATATVAGTSNAITQSTHGTVSLLGSGNTVTSGATNQVYVAGNTSNTIGGSNGRIVGYGNNATITLTGNLQEVWLHAGESGAQVTGAVVYGSNAVVDIGAGGTANVVGNNNTFDLGTSVGLSVAGSGLTINGSGVGAVTTTTGTRTVTYGGEYGNYSVEEPYTYTSFTLSAPGDTITLAPGALAAINGYGNTIAVTGGNTRVSTSNNTITIGNGVLGTNVIGNDNTITGANNTVTVLGQWNKYQGDFSVVALSAGDNNTATGAGTQAPTYAAAPPMFTGTTTSSTSTTITGNAAGAAAYVGGYVTSGGGEYGGAVTTWDPNFQAIYGYNYWTTSGAALWDTAAWGDIQAYGYVPNANTGGGGGGGGYVSSGGEYDPIVIDLGRDGIQLIDLANSTAAFNYGGGGVRTAWAGPNDGMLVLQEANGFLRLDLRAYAPGAANDLEALALAFDTNQNKKLDSGDARWSDFRIFRDGNSDGVAQGSSSTSSSTSRSTAGHATTITTTSTTTSNSEVVALAVAGVVSIDLVGQTVARTFSEGTIYSAATTVAMTDFNTGQVVTTAAGAFSFATAAATSQPTPYFLTGSRPTTWNVPAGGGGGGCYGEYDPIVLDLARDGLAHTGLAESHMRFDYEGTGDLVRTAWASAGDGVLVLQDGDRLLTDLRPFAPGATHDLEALAVFDTNGNRKFDADDASWHAFRVFVDSNGDGQVATHELLTLDTAGVWSIDLELTPLDQRLSDGSMLHATTTFTARDGTTAAAGAFSFAIETPTIAAEQLVSAMGGFTGAPAGIADPGANTTLGDDEMLAGSTLLPQTRR